VKLSVTIALVLLLVVGAQPARAQVLPEAPVSNTDLGDLIGNPGKWLTTMFNGALASLGRKTTSDVVDFMSWLLGGGANVISQTPPGLSYANSAVQELSGTLRKAANGGLAVVTAWGGINLMLNRHIRTPYHGVLELLPRVVLSGVLVNTSLDWGRLAIDLNNALCQVIGTAAVPGWASAGQVPQGETELMNLIAIAIYLVMGLLLLGQMLMRLALVDALLAIAPLALLCWALPQTYSWARLWFTTFFGAVFVQSIQVLVLRMGADLIDRLPTMLPAVAADPIGHTRVWLTTLLLGIAVLQLARRIPRFIPGLPLGGFPSLPRAKLDGARDVMWLARMAGPLRGKR
jgi:hypothetical protein